jgi:hypothetical protein
MMSDLQETNWKLFEEEFMEESLNESLNKSKKAFDTGWACAADEAFDYLNGIGQFGLAGQVRDMLLGDWLEEVDE